MATTLELDVEVRQDDIDHGKARDCHECPGARAINRELDKLFGPGRFVSSVGGSVLIYRVDNPDAKYIRDVGPTVFWEIVACQELSHLISKVDRQDPEDPAKPMSFHLSLTAVTL